MYSLSKVKDLTMTDNDILEENIKYLQELYVL